MISNNEAVYYAVIALDQLINTGLIKTTNKKKALDILGNDMHKLMDELTTDEAEEKHDKLVYR